MMKRILISVLLAMLCACVLTSCGIINSLFAPEVDTPDVPTLTYEEYIAMSAEEQKAYYDSFPTYHDFFAWYNAAKAEYEAVHGNPLLPDDGDVDVDVDLTPDDNENGGNEDEPGGSIGVGGAIPDEDMPNGGNPEGTDPEGSNPEGENKPEGTDPEGGDDPTDTPVEGGDKPNEGNDPEGEDKPEGTDPEGSNPEGENKPEGTDPEGGDDPTDTPAEGGDDPNEGDDPDNTDPEGTVPDDGNDPEVDNDENRLLTYEEYDALSAEEKNAYYLSFPTYQDFFEWYNAAYQEYLDANKGDDIGDGNIDLGGK